jgi:hypothetical protein
MEINKYQNGKIYQIVSYSHPELIYYGSTIQSLSVRMAGHRRDMKRGRKTTAEQIICFDDANILLIENYPCNSKEELNKREGEYIKNNLCVNKNIAGRTLAEWTTDNKEIIKDKKKIYYEGNKVKIAIQEKIYRTNNKNKRKENGLKYYENNKVKIATQGKIYRTNNKDKRKEYENNNKEKRKATKIKIILCDCGCNIQNQNMNDHIKTKKHLKLMEDINNKLIV